MPQHWVMCICLHSAICAQSGSPQAAHVDQCYTYVSTSYTPNHTSYIYNWGGCVGPVITYCIPHYTHYRVWVWPVTTSLHTHLEWAWPVTTSLYTLRVGVTCHHLTIYTLRVGVTCHHLTIYTLRVGVTCHHLTIYTLRVGVAWHHLTIYTLRVGMAWHHPTIYNHICSIGVCLWSVDQRQEMCAWVASSATHSLTTRKPYFSDQFANRSVDYLSYKEFLLVLSEKKMIHQKRMTAYIATIHISSHIYKSVLSLFFNWQCTNHCAHAPTAVYMATYANTTVCGEVTSGYICTFTPVCVVWCMVTW